MSRIKRAIPKGYLTIDEAAKRIGISRATLWAWSKDEDIKGYILKGRTLYKEKDVDELISRQP